MAYYLSDTTSVGNLGRLRQTLDSDFTDLLVKSHTFMILKTIVLFGISIKSDHPPRNYSEKWKAISIIMQKHI